MPINYWRHVKYLDDGVSEFQCLNCKAKWNSPDGPGYMLDGNYHPFFIYCPFCAVKWEGTKCDEYRKFDYLSKRRQRIELALEPTRYINKPGLYWRVYTLPISSPHHGWCLWITHPERNISAVKAYPWLKQKISEKHQLYPFYKYQIRLEFK